MTQKKIALEKIYMSTYEERMLLLFLHPDDNRACGAKFTSSQAAPFFIQKTKICSGKKNRLKVRIHLFYDQIAEEAKGEL